MCEIFRTEYYSFEFRNLFTKWAIVDYKTNYARAPKSE